MNLKETSFFIAKRRMELGLTQEAVARCVNVTAKAVSKWERGLSFPDVALFNNLADVLKCSVADLINGSFINDKSSHTLSEDVNIGSNGSDVTDNKSICFDFNSKSYVSPLLFGNNLEHTRNSVHLGISAQMLENRKFVGKPNAKGCANGWKIVGENTYLEFSKPYTSHDKDYHMKRMLECNAQRIISFKDGELCGICQDGLYVQKNTEYSFSLAVRSLRDCDLIISLTDNGSEICREVIRVEKNDEYVEKQTTLRPCADGENVTLSIAFDIKNTIDVGAVSMMPSDNFYGMRRDVIERMKEMGISVLRWPGGNFAGEYNWKDGLMSPNKRAPFQSYLNLETQPHTMGYDFHEINTDDFIMLCREIGAEPFITINPTWNTPKETAQWVEYCNGDETTEYGRIRISRGHEEPYNVKRWSLGNEFGYGHMEGTNNPYEYSKAVRRHANAMLDVTQHLSLCSAGNYPDAEWTIHSAKPLSDVARYVSVHRYIDYPNFGDPSRYKEEYESFIKNVLLLKEAARQLRSDLNDDKIRISFDEWNSWYAWYRPQNVCDGIFAAAAIHMFINEAERLGIDIVCHFEAVNEGAVAVDAKSAELTPMGTAFAVMKHHKCGKILFANDNVVATENDGIITATLINPSYDEAAEYKLPLCKNSGHGVLYSSESVLPYSYFTEQSISFVAEKNHYIIKMPPHSIAMFIQE